MSQKLKLRIIVVGDDKTGKTSFIKKYIDPECNIDSNTTTYATEAYGKEYTYCEGLVLELSIWDTYAGDRDSGLSNLFTRNARGGFIMTDINDETTFDGAKKWVKMLRKKTELPTASKGPGKGALGKDTTFCMHKETYSEIPMILLGNKCDLFDEDEEKFAIAEKIIKAQAKELGVDMGILISCKDNYNIEMSFKMLIKKLDSRGFFAAPLTSKMSSSSYSDIKSLSVTTFSKKHDKKKGC